MVLLVAGDHCVTATDLLGVAATADELLFVVFHGLSVGVDLAVSLFHLFNLVLRFHNWCDLLLELIESDHIAGLAGIAHV